MRKQFGKRGALALGLAALAVLGASAAAPRWAGAQTTDATDAPAKNQIRVGGAVTKPGGWSSAQMADQFAKDIQAVTYTLKGVKHRANRAFPLRDLIAAAAPKVNPHVKHGELQFVIAVTGQDGYTVDFSYAELLPEFGNRPVWVALDEDGKALTGESGPAALIVPDDVKPARWVHSLAKVTVVDGSQMAEGQ